MRGTHTRKRTGSTLSRTYGKKRRVFKRRRTTRKTSAWTSQSGGSGGVGFGRRRTNRRIWKRLLWNSSIAQTHYRSNNSAVSTITTTTTPATMTLSLQTTRRFAGNAFWTTAGGAINPDGGAIPTFATNTDFTIRGGMYGIRVTNNPDLADTDKDALSVTVFQVWTSKGFLVGPLATSAVNVGWDPTLVTDFQTQVGKVLSKKTFLLAEGESMTIEKRMKLQKIDQTEYGATISEPIWIVLVGNMSAVSVKSLAVTTYYNMSFVGDAV